jgi:hypothetical protein
MQEQIPFNGYSEFNTLEYVTQTIEELGEVVKPESEIPNNLSRFIHFPWFYDSKSEPDSLGYYFYENRIIHLGIHGDFFYLDGNEFELSRLICSSVK